ncbi:hypothetical protein HDU82_008183 [Entophlyctis luteolus]|nr:hypothetical protein HDU82_008183 [Entophlyctis luteolus]
MPLPLAPLAPGQAPAAAAAVVGPTSMSVFFANEVHIDRGAWQLWLAGFTVDQAFGKVLERARHSVDTAAAAAAASALRANPSTVKNYILSQVPRERACANLKTRAD